MCGRYSNARSDDEIRAEFRVVDTVGEPPEPSWNVAPTDARRVVLDRARRGEGEPDGAAVRQLRTARWGLVPSWAKDVKVGNRLINARSETITEKSSFRTAAARRRCLVPADGYYEWETLEGRKVPYFLHREDHPLAFAGLYELWPDPSRERDDPDRWVWSYTVLTRPAPDSLGHIHDRSPVVLPPGLVDDWLDPDVTDPERVRALLAAIPDPALTPHEVSPEVNNVRNDGPGLVAAAFS